MEIPDFIHITAVEPPLFDGAGPGQQRRFLVYPGGTAPCIGIELASKDGRRRRSDRRSGHGHTPSGAGGATSERRTASRRLPEVLVLTVIMGIACCAGL